MSSSSSSPISLSTLPQRAQFAVFSNLEAKDLRSLASVNRYMNKISSQDILWKSLFENDYPLAKFSKPYSISWKEQYFIHQCKIIWKKKVIDEFGKKHAIKLPYENWKEIYSRLNEKREEGLSKVCFNNLPSEILENILSNLNAKNLSSLAKVSKKMNIESSVDHLWKTLFNKNPLFNKKDSKLEHNTWKKEYLKQYDEKIWKNRVFVDFEMAGTKPSDLTWKEFYLTLEKALPQSVKTMRSVRKTVRSSLEHVASFFHILDFSGYISVKDLNIKELKDLNIKELEDKKFPRASTISQLAQGIIQSSQQFIASATTPFRTFSVTFSTLTSHVSSYVNRKD